MQILDTIIQPFKVLKEAIEKVPFVKYALGIAGIAAAIATIKTFGIENYKIPLISILIFLGLMVLLFVFSSLTKSSDKFLKFAGYALVYTTVVVTCLSAILLFTSVFFKSPDKIENLISPKSNAENTQLSIDDLFLEISLMKSDSTYQDLTKDEIEKYIKIDPPLNKLSKEETFILKFNLPVEYQKNFTALKFNFGKEFYKNLTIDLLGMEEWASFQLGTENRYFISEPNYFPSKLVFAAKYQTLK